MPLPAGTNTVTVSATDAAGNKGITNIAVVQSDIELAMSPVPEDQLHRLSLSLAGTVSAADYTVWVNGVQAAVDGFGNWSADNVPVNAGGTASFYVTAYPPGENPGAGAGGSGMNPSSPNTCNLAVDEDKPDRFYVSEYHDGWDHEITNYRVPRDHAQTENDSMEWTDGVGGGRTHVNNYDPSTNGPNRCTSGCQWPRDTWSPSLPSAFEWSCDDGSAAAGTNGLPPVVGMEHCDRQVSGSPWGCVREAAGRTADGAEKYFAGGKALPAREYLVIASASATAYLNPLYTGTPFYLISGGDSQGVDVPVTNIVLDTFGRLGPNGQTAAVVSAGATVAATTHVEGTNFFGAVAGATKYSPRIYRNFSDITDKTNTVYVGEQMSLICVLDPPGGPGITNYQWRIPGTYVGDYLHAAMLGTNVPCTLTNDVVIYYWVDKLDAGDVTCKVKAAGKELSAKTTFKVLKPTADWTGQSCGVFSLQEGDMRFADVTNGVDGMTFTFTNMSLLGYTNTQSFQSAQLGFTEVRFEGTNSSGAAKTVTFTAQGLDGAFPYTDFGSAAGGNTVDSPGGPVGPSDNISPLVYVSSVTYSGQFNHYLFFLPAGAWSIPVAAKRIGWQFSMQAINSGASSAPDPLVSSNCTATVTSDNVPVTGNPEWTNNLIFPIKTVTP